MKTRTLWIVLYTFTCYAEKDFAAYIFPTKAEAQRYIKRRKSLDDYSPNTDRFFIHRTDVPYKEVVH